jgi:hypothetical protein
MNSSSVKSELTTAALSLKPADEVVRQRVHQIGQDLISGSRYVREPDFKSIHPFDLEFLFRAYDERFFASHCGRALEGRRLSFRLSPRMTRTGGKTTRFTTRSGEVSFEIAVASSILFDGFGEMDRRISVCGLECESRVEALQRIFEHELVHLIEQLCWDNSDCAAGRFQDIAGRCFLHRAHTHNLITRRERAAESGIRVGSEVTFTFEGRHLTGRVNRITKRATVLVEDPKGAKYSDGLRYTRYYVPISHLRLSELRQDVRS